ncbi:MAG: SAM-dependent methyltransferase [Micavibrio sp.]
MNIEHNVIKNYPGTGLADKILTALDGAAVTTESLSPFDELHVGGRAATRYLMQVLHLMPGMQVLDIGSGLGGAARYAAETFSATVTGLDLSPDYTAVAEMLSEKAGLSERVSFHTGTAVSMPFASQAFDAAYSIHTAMNIEDKLELYKEVRRVLKPGALFGLYDVLAGERPDDPDFPLPWSDTPATSFLLTIHDLRMLLEMTGFEILSAEERKAFARESLEKALATKNPGGIALARGDDFAVRIANLSVAIADSRCALWQIICRKK